MMSRVVLVHWKPEEAGNGVAALRKAGHTVQVYSEQGGEGLRRFRARPPDAFVIDLDRLPSHGRAVGVFLRQQKATRAVPLLFVGGTVEKVARIRREIPDATFTAWDRIRSALRRALSASPKQVAVPGTMGAYSATPLPKKLRIKANSTLALLNAPDRFEETLGKLPENVEIKRRARGRAQRRADVVILFNKSRADLKQRLGSAKRMLADGGALWLAWPKKAAGLRTDLAQDDVRRTGLAAGLMDYKICSINETWSGLCFCRNRANRRHA